MTTGIVCLLNTCVCVVFFLLVVLRDLVDLQEPYRHGATKRAIKPMREICKANTTSPSKKQDDHTRKHEQTTRRTTHHRFVLAAGLERECD